MKRHHLTFRSALTAALAFAGALTACALEYSQGWEVVFTGREKEDGSRGHAEFIFRILYTTGKVEIEDVTFEEVKE